MAVLLHGETGMSWSRLLALLVPCLLAGTVLRSLPESAAPGRCGPARVVLGVNTQGGPEVDLVDRAGLRRVRFTIPWREVNPEPGMWRWEAVDAVVEAHHAAGHEMLAILSTAPTWAGSNRNGTRPPQDVALWQELVARTARRYAGRIGAYEVWNEPDRGDEGPGVGWIGVLSEPPAYAVYLRAAALEIRENAPGTLVVAPAVGSDPRKATVDLFRHLEDYRLPEGGASRFVDIVSLHANARGDDRSEEVWARVRQHFRTLARRNPSNLRKPVWITEAGWSSAAAGEDGQRLKTANLLAHLASEWDGVEHPLYCGADRSDLVVYLYKERDGGGELRGLFRRDGTPKPVVAELLRQLDPPGVITGRAPGP